MDGLATLSPPGAVGPDFALATGAGAGIGSGFMQAVLTGLAARGHTTTVFQSAYQAAGRRRPEPATVLEGRVREVAGAVRGERPLVLGGKSMGGRMASRVVADGLPCAGLVYFGYPLHPAGRPERLRVEHLAGVPVPMLFLTGTRDPLCRLDLLDAHVRPLPLVTVHLVEGGDHSLTVRGRPDALAEVLDVAVLWARALP